MSDQLISKSFAAPTLDVDLKKRTVRHWVTTNALDEEGEVLLPRGADVSRFKKGGTVFDVHEYGSKNVIGKCLSYEVTDKGHIAVTQFAARPPANLLPEGVAWEPDRILWLYSTGDITGWSIGMNGLSARMPTKKDMEDYGQDIRRVWTRYRVLEYSVAPLPCNAEAMTMAGKGLLSKSLAEKLVLGTLPEVAPPVEQEQIIVPSVRINTPKAIPNEEIIILRSGRPAKVDRTAELVEARLSGKMWI